MRALVAMWMMLSVCSIALGSGCQDTFEAPPLPDLYKTPKDLSGAVFDGGATDDLSTTGSDLGRRDLATSKDLLPTLDLPISLDHDLAEVDSN